MQNPEQRHSSPAPWKVTVWAILLAGFLFALADVFFGANRVVEGAGQLVKTARNAVSPPEVKTRLFEVFGSRIAVGCEESLDSRADAVVPDGAFEVQRSCEWTDMDDLRSHSCATEIKGTTVSATGTIRGRDREWTGNCPGGGHGKLRLTGTYKIREG